MRISVNFCLIFDRTHNTISQSKIAESTELVEQCFSV